MRKLPLVLWLPLAASAFAQQTLSITGVPASLAAGQSFAFTLSATAPAQGWAGIGYQLTLVNATLVSQVAATPAAAAKDVDCAPTTAAGVTTCIVIGALASAIGPATGLNANAVTASGAAVTVTATAGASATMTATLAAVSMTDPGGNVVAIAPGPSVSVPIGGGGGGGGGGGDPGTISSLSCAPATVVGAGTSSCTITLSGNAPTGGAAISLASNSASVTVPATFTITGGNITGTFTATASAVATGATVTLTATYNGSSQTAAITLMPAAVVTISSFACNPSSVTGGSSTLCTIGLSAAAPTGGINMPLYTQSGGLVTAPAALNIPAGSSMASFQATTVAVMAPTPQVLSISYNGTLTTTSITLMPPSSTPPAISSLTCPPVPAGGAGSSTCTVNLSANAGPSGAVISLTSSSAFVSVPPALTIESGNAAGVFMATLSAVTSAVTVTLTATYNGSSQTASITLTSAAVTNYCDLDRNGVVDGNDVNLQISWTLGTSAPPAGVSAMRLAGETTPGAADVQVIVNAALGQTCTATQ